MISTMSRRAAEAGKLVPIDVKAGDRILFGKWSGTEHRSIADGVGWDYGNHKRRDADNKFHEVHQYDR